MGILSWIILGLIAGFIGSKIVNKSGSGLLLDIVIGIVGAVVGGFISANLLGIGIEHWYSPVSILIAIAGAVIVLVVYNAVARR